MHPRDQSLWTVREIRQLGRSFWWVGNRGESNQGEAGIQGKLADRTYQQREASSITQHARLFAIVASPLWRHNAATQSAGFGIVVFSRFG
jgi:hypothetical protein